jgi:molybdenum cofactor synthesis domain-containing protein
VGADVNGDGLGATAEGQLVAVNVSDRKGVSKTPVDRAVIDGSGLVGDAHAGPWHRQVSLLAGESIDRFGQSAGRAFAPGEFAENLTTRGLDLADTSLLDRFRIGSVELEVTQLGKRCHGDGCAIFQAVGRCVMPKEGLFCRVLSGGEVRPGERVVQVKRRLRCLVVTLSDRASRGEYEDRSGPCAQARLKEHFAGTRWRLDVRGEILPDDAESLRALLVAAAPDADVIITTGGTGLGPRDITPDVVANLADRLVPGVMEAIRVKFGAGHPSALLSRSVAAVVGQTLVYTLPGSVRAVDEYLGEILKTLEHAICMLHGLDTH